MKAVEPMDAFSISESFSDYLQKVYVDPPDKAACEELKMAFFAGAYQVRATMEMLRSLHPNMARCALTRMDDDIIGHLKDILNPKVPVSGKNGTTP